MQKIIGIPQNRERVYTISIRKDIDNKLFKFPEKETLKLRLKDMLETKVDEKYYLSNEIIEKYIQSNNSENTNVIGKLVMDKWQDNMKRIYNTNTYAPAINTMQGGNLEPKILEMPVLVKNATKKGYIKTFKGDSINLAYRNSTTRRGRVGHQISQTLTTTDNIAVLEVPYIVASRGRNPIKPSSRIAGEYLKQRLEINRNGTTNCISTVQKDNYVVDKNIKIRKLTPLECWRLMGFSDEDFKKAEEINSNTQLYKQAGNSIVVKVLEKIFENLFLGR